MGGLRDGILDYSVFSPAYSKMIGINSKQASRAILRSLIFFLLLLGVLALQSHSNVWESAFGTDPDEPGHFVSSLMVRDYVLHGFGTPPIAFAQDYYVRRPFVTIGHWPPVFYAVAGAWMVVAGNSKLAAMVLIALFSTLVAFMIFRLAREWTHALPAFIAGLLYLSPPIARDSHLAIMSDGLIALLLLWGAIILKNYFVDGAYRYLVWFWILAAVSVLVKFNAAPILGLPWLAVVALRRFDLLRDVRFWSASLIAAVPIAIWIAIAHPFLHTGMLARRPMPWEEIAVLFTNARNGLGLVLLIALCLALVDNFRAIVRREALESLLLLLVVSNLIYILVAPVPKTGRYLLVALPCAILLLARSIARYLPERRLRFGVASVLLGILIFSLVEYPTLPVFRPSPLEGVLSYLASRNDDTARSILVPGEMEGPFVAEYSTRFSFKRGDILLRPNKLFARIDWNGERYATRIDSPSDISKFLLSERVDYVVLFQSSRPRSRWPHLNAIADGITRDTANWRCDSIIETQRGVFLIYSNAQSPSPRGHISEKLREFIIDSIGIPISTIPSQSDR